MAILSLLRPSVKTISTLMLLLLLLMNDPLPCLAFQQLPSVLPRYNNKIKNAKNSFLPATREKTKNNNDATEVPFFIQQEPERKDASDFASSNNMDLEKSMMTTTTTMKLTDTLSIKSDNMVDDEASVWLWRGVVAVLCALWASNFAFAKLVMAEPGVDSSLYALARFGVAALALLPGSIVAIRRGGSGSEPIMDWETAKAAAICGSWVSFGYLGQTLALLTTTASRACVICTLHCVFVAAVAEFMRVTKLNNDNQQKLELNVGTVNDNDEEKAKFNIMRLVPAAVAVLGVAIVELKGAGGAPTIGDALSFAQPIGFGLGYLQLEGLMKKSPEAGLPISAIKLCMVAFFSFLMFETLPYLQQLLLHQQQSSSAAASTLTAVALSSLPPSFAFRIPDFSPIIHSPLALGGILYTGLVTTALALWVESIAFKRVPATDASIILTTEPLFAAAAGAFYLGETFGLSDYAGATLIMGACALAVIMEQGEEVKECPVDALDCEISDRQRPISPN